MVAVPSRMDLQTILFAPLQLPRSQVLVYVVEILEDGRGKYQILFPRTGEPSLKRVASLYPVFTFVVIGTTVLVQVNTLLVRGQLLKLEHHVNLI